MQHKLVYEAFFPLRARNPLIPEKAAGILLPSFFSVIDSFLFPSFLRDLKRRRRILLLPRMNSGGPKLHWKYHVFAAFRLPKGVLENFPPPRDPFRRTNTRMIARKEGRRTERRRRRFARLSSGSASPKEWLDGYRVTMRGETKLHFNALKDEFLCGDLSLCASD